MGEGTDNAIARIVGTGHYEATIEAQVLIGPAGGEDPPARHKFPTLQEPAEFLFPVSALPFLFHLGRPAGYTLHHILHIEL